MNICLADYTSSGRKRGVSRSRGKNRHIEQVRNHEVFRACLPQHLLALRNARGNLPGPLIGSAGGGAENVVSTALDDVQRVRIGFASVLE